jgi:hypothetical protein
LFGCAEQQGRIKIARRDDGLKHKYATPEEIQALQHKVSFRVSSSDVVDVLSDCAGNEAVAPAGG